MLPSSLPWQRKFLRDPATLQQARDKFQARIAETPYVSPIPDGVPPPLES